MTLLAVTVMFLLAVLLVMVAPALLVNWPVPTFKTKSPPLIATAPSTVILLLPAVMVVSPVRVEALMVKALSLVRVVAALVRVTSSTLVFRPVTACPPVIVRV